MSVQQALGVAYIKIGNFRLGQRLVIFGMLAGFLVSMAAPSVMAYAETPYKQTDTNPHIKRLDDNTLDKPMGQDYPGPTDGGQAAYPMATDAVRPPKGHGLGIGDTVPVGSPIQDATAGNRFKKEELVSKRTPTSTFFRNEDGSVTEKQYLTPHFFKGDGGWKTIKSNLIEDKNAANSTNVFGRFLGSLQSKLKSQPNTFKMEDNAWQVQFAPSDDAAGMVRVTYEGKTVTFRPVGANSVDPVITNDKEEGQQVLYRDLWIGVDVEYKVQNEMLKEFTILKNSKVAPVYSFAVEGADLEPDKEHPGGFKLRGDLKNVFSVAPLTVQDAVGNTIKKEVAKQAFRNGELTITVDAQWLKSLPAGSFPVVIDPTLWINVWDGSWSHHYTYGSSGWWCDYSPQTCEPMAGSARYSSTSYEYIRSAIKAHYWGAWGKRIWSAKLHIAQMPGAVGSSQGRWTTAQNAACFGPGNYYDCIDWSAPRPWAWFSGSGVIDVTSLFVHLQSYGEYEPWILLSGEECGNCGSLKMFNPSQTFFEITYAPDAPVIGDPTPGGVTTYVDPQVSFSINTPNPVPPYPLQYAFRIGTRPDGGGVIFTSGFSSARQWTVPDGILEDGATYYAQAQAYEAQTNTYSWWSSVVKFKIDMRNGKDSTQAFDELGPVSVAMATGNMTTNASSHTSNALGGSLGINLEYNSPVRSRPGLVGQYFNNTTYSGTPVVTRTDPYVDFNWGEGGSASPVPGVINADYFSALWQGFFVAPRTASYQFGCMADDSARVWVNNQLVSERWTGYTGTHECPWSSPVPLTVGQLVPFKMAYREDTGWSLVRPTVKTTDGAIAAQTIKQDWLQTGVRPVATKHGLMGRYYYDDGSHNFSAQANEMFMQRNDPLVGFDWGTNGPVMGGRSDNFLVRWTGYLTVPTTGTYELGAHGDDGMRIKINNATIVDNWAAGAYPIIYSAPVSLIANTPVPITVEYFEVTSNAYAGLHIKSASMGMAAQVVPNAWLSTDTAVLPDGWSLGIDPDGGLSYERLKAQSNSVVLTDSTGSTHEYTWTGSAYRPPVNEDGQLVRNADGTFTMQDGDGRTYIFNTEGLLTSVTSPTDDRKPAALKYNYTTINNGPARITSIVDGVDPSRSAQVYYSGSSECGSVPAGFDAQAPTNMLCALKTNDGRATYFYYYNQQLARIAEPGNELTDYVYETLSDGSKRISAIRDPLANDAIAAGTRVNDSTALTEITYDDLGRVSKVTQPAATAGAARVQHALNYFVSEPGSTYLGATEQHIVGASEPHGFSRRLEYDKTLRTIKDIDIANLAITTEWDVTKDIVLSTADATGLKSTTIYDSEDRPVDQYGPAPATWFGTDRKPLAAYIGQIPHTETAYDEGMKGLAVAYYGNTKLTGAPTQHRTALDESGNIYKNLQVGLLPANTSSGWSMRLTGKIKLAEVGNHIFHTYSDDGTRVYIDDQLILSDWTDGTVRPHGDGVFYNATANSWHRIMLEYYDRGNGDAWLELHKQAPGSARTYQLGNIMVPDYGLVTTAKTYDATLGNSEVKTNYGSSPEFGLTQSTSVDPTGLNLTTTNTYEQQGATGSFLRQTSKNLPGSPSANPSFSYSYYGATETADNPCTTSVTESYKQAGFMKLKAEADPDGTGPQTGRTTQTIYDDTGRVVATRYNNDSWTCTTYDARGRVITTVVPSIVTQKPDGGTKTLAGRTITNGYAVGGNPLVTATTDPMGSISTTIDLLGRVISYTDTYGETTTSIYDNLGRLVGRSGPLGDEEFTYDNYDRLVNQKLDSVIYATVYYDQYSRIDHIDYPNAGSQKLTLGRDSLGRTDTMSYSLLNASSQAITVSDAVTRSQSGQTLTDTINNAGASSTWSYGYDAADRLTSATLAGALGSQTYTYGFGQQDASCGTANNMNPNAGKNSNRTNQTVNGATTTFCYDYADRLVSSSNALYNAAIYDAHGNMTKIGTGSTPFRLYYDSSDRNSGMDQYDANGNGVAQYYDRDVQGRIVARYKNYIANWEWYYGDGQYYFFTGSGDTPDYVRDDNWTITEKYLQLPGGVLLTIRPAQTGNNQKIYSLPNIHGDVFAATNASGVLTATTTTGPFGEPISGQSKPTNTSPDATYSYVGQHQKLTETGFVLTATQMGARVYLPELGRFAQVDPIEGGTENNYVYPTDPVNEFDLTGEESRRNMVVDYLTNPLRFGWGHIAGSYTALRGGSYSKGYDKGILAYDVVGTVATLGAGGRALLNRNFTKHALEQMAGRDGGRGVLRSAVNHALKHGRSLGPKRDSLGRWSWVYESNRARVAVNSKGKVVTALAKSKQYWNKKWRW